MDGLQIGRAHLTTGVCNFLQWVLLIAAKVESTDAIIYQLLVFNGEKGHDNHLALVSCREIFLLRSDLFGRMWKSVNPNIAYEVDG